MVLTSDRRRITRLRRSKHFSICLHVAFRKRSKRTRDPRVTGWETIIGNGRHVLLLGAPPLSYLTDEYKILQDKIDKIGAFRVTIKGWSVTATVAFFLAVASEKGLSPALGAVAINVLLGFFFWFEREQTELGWKFGSRARNIEVQIDRRRRKAGQKGFFSSPNIARALFGTKKPAVLIRHEFKNRKLEKCRAWINRESKLAAKANILFYLVLILASWVPVWAGMKSQNPPPPVVIQNIIQVPADNKPLTPALPSIGDPTGNTRKSK